MTHTGSELGTDLYELVTAGHAFQGMGQVHQSAAGTVSGVDPSSAFSRPEEVGMGSTGFSDAWASAAHSVVAMLQTNGESLDDCGQALIWCAEVLFAGADQDAKDRFTRLGGRL